MRGDTVLDAVSRNTSKVTRKILFLGPRIAVRGDTVLDAVSREYRQKHLQNTFFFRPFPGPRITCGVTPLVIPRFDAVSRNIRGGESLLLFLLGHELGPRIECGVTQKKRRHCYRAELVAGCAIVGGCGTRHRLRHSSSSIHLWLARSLPDKDGVLRLFYLSSCGAWQLYFLYS